MIRTRSTMSLSQILTPLALSTLVFTAGTSAQKATPKQDSPPAGQSRAELQEKLQRMAMRNGAGSAHSQLELARVARSWGLEDEMWRYLASALRSGAQSKTMQRRTRAFMASLENEVLPKKWHKADPKTKVWQLLRRLKGSKVPRAKLHTVATLLAEVPEADAHLKRRARAATGLRRMASIRALAHGGDAKNERFVYRTAVLDSSPEVRREAMRITREIGKSTEAVNYLSPGLTVNNAKARLRTAAAFGELKDPAALPLLVAAGPKAAFLKRKALPGGATRANMAVITQQSFIRDYDVEVAQASFIADPKVDVLHSGVVLDVTVAAVTTRRTEIVGAYRNAIRRIAGSDPGPDPNGWADWLKQRPQPKVAAKQPR